MEISAINSRYNVSAKSQYETYPNNMTTSYPSYIEEPEQPKSSGLLGLTILGVLAAAGIGYGIYKHRDTSALSKSLKDTKAALDDVTQKLANSEEKVSTAEKALEAANKTIESLKQPAKKSSKFSWKSLMFWKNWGKKKA